MVEPPGANLHIGAHLKWMPMMSGANWLIFHLCHFHTHTQTHKQCEQANALSYVCPLTCMSSWQSNWHCTNEFGGGAVRPICRQIFALAAGLTATPNATEPNHVKLCDAALTSY